MLWSKPARCTHAARTWKTSTGKRETSLLAVDFVRETSCLFFRVVKSPRQRTTALTKRKTTATKLLSTATTVPNKHLFWLQIGNVCECVSAIDGHPVFHHTDVNRKIREKQFFDHRIVNLGVPQLRSKKHNRPERRTAGSRRDR